ncbi:hypothetical protein Pyn_09908 [Prunus yedoensis var. nudiflora]|uniref:Uncharacterized protein n=1 Tax=Prunus yedoensis var. nudiflora TaxID=2094558 RepID=A0A314XYZ8_PRUYE|nr:hypothetical protein Pyn_09908 [Prunus yedoensis var. nudiflora]
MERGEVPRGRAFGGFRSFRQLGSVSVGTVAILPKYGRWRKWASKHENLQGFSREEACSLKMVVVLLFWLGRRGPIYSCLGLLSSRNPKWFVFLS